MLELKRILWNRRSLLLFGLLLFLHGVFFFFQCNEAKSNTLTGEALTEYVDGYEEYVRSVHENVEMMQDNPLFGEKDSFVYRNLIKTGKDYARLDGIVPVAGENRGIVTLLNFNLTNFVLLLVGLYIVLCFMAERQKGLYLLVRSTERGRMQLSLQRIGILGFGILAAVVLLYGSIFLMSMRLFPGCDMARPVQSIPEFEGVIGRYSIGTYLLVFLLKKVIGCLFVCLILYFFMSLFRSSFCVAAFFLFFAGEYGLYVLMIPTSKWGVLKYLNLYTYLFCGTEYAAYYNLNFFGYPFHIAAGAGLLVFFGTAGMILLCLFRYSRQYPKGEYRNLRIVERMSAAISKHKPSASMTGWELKKVLLSQKGLVIFVLLFYLAFSASTESGYKDLRSKYVTHWYEEYGGEISGEKVTALQDRKSKLEERIRLWENWLLKAGEMMQKYMMEGKDISYIASSISEYERLIQENEKEVSGISLVLTQAEEGYAYMLESGDTIELIDPTAWNLLFYNDKRTILRNYLYSLLTVVLMLSGIMACEKAAHMEHLLRSLYKGRGQVLTRKIAIMFGICILATLPIHLIQYFQIGEALTYADFDAKVQSISCVRFFPLQVTIRQFLVLLYSFRTLCSIAVGGVIMFFSSKFSRIATITFGVFFIVLLMGLIALRF